MAQIRSHEPSAILSDRADQMEVLFAMSRYVREELEKLESANVIFASTLESRLGEELVSLRATDPNQPMFEVRTSDF